MSSIPYNYGKYIDDKVSMTDQGHVDSGKQISSPASAGSRGLAKTTQFTKDRTQMQMGQTAISESMVEIRNILNRIDGVNAPVPEAAGDQEKMQGLLQWFKNKYDTYRKDFIDDQIENGIRGSQLEQAVENNDELVELENIIDALKSGSMKDAIEEINRAKYEFSGIPGDGDDFMQVIEKLGIPKDTFYFTKDESVSEDDGDERAIAAMKLARDEDDDSEYIKQAYMLAVKHHTDGSGDGNINEDIGDLIEDYNEKADKKISPEQIMRISKKYNAGGDYVEVLSAEGIDGKLWLEVAKKKYSQLESADSDELGRLKELSGIEEGHYPHIKSFDKLYGINDMQQYKAMADDAQTMDMREFMDTYSSVIDMAGDFWEDHQKTSESNEGAVNEDPNTLAKELASEIMRYVRKGFDHIPADALKAKAKEYLSSIKESAVKEKRDNSDIDIRKLLVDISSMKDRIAELAIDDNAKTSAFTALAQVEDDIAQEIKGKFPEAVKEDLDYRSEDILNKAGFDPADIDTYMKVFNDHGDTSDLDQMNMKEKVGLAEVMSIVLASHGIQNESYQPFPEGDEFDIEEDEDFEEVLGPLGFPEDETELFDAEYRGRKVPLNKPMRGDVKKFKVYVKDPKTGNVKKVNFGHGGTSAKRKTMRIRKSNPKARKSFRARHNCANPGPKTKARYWSCRKW